MKNKKWFGYVLLIGIVILIYILAPTKNEYICNKEMDIYKDSFSGIIVEKYIDTENHMYPIVKVENREGKSRTINLSFDTSQFFEIVKKGDYIEKENNSLRVMINDSSNVRIDYGAECPSHN